MSKTGRKAGKHNIKQAVHIDLKLSLYVHNWYVCVHVFSESLFFQNLRSRRKLPPSRRGVQQDRGSPEQLLAACKLETMLVLYCRWFINTRDHFNSAFAVSGRQSFFFFFWSYNWKSEKKKNNYFIFYVPHLQWNSQLWLDYVCVKTFVCFHVQECISLIH